MGWDKGDIYEMELLKAQKPKDCQVRANEAAKPLLIGKSPEPVDQDFDDIPVMDKGAMAILWGIGDPGDETNG